eukprot:scaffold92283_cov75-Phaeocystis_antarctica.AAC.6
MAERRRFARAPDLPDATSCECHREETRTQSPRPSSQAASGHCILGPSLPKPSAAGVAECRGGAWRGAALGLERLSQRSELALSVRPPGCQPWLPHAKPRSHLRSHLVGGAASHPATGRRASCQAVPPAFHFGGLRRLLVAVVPAERQSRVGAGALRAGEGEWQGKSSQLRRRAESPQRPPFGTRCARRATSGSASLRSARRHPRARLEGTASNRWPVRGRGGVPSSPPGEVALRTTTARPRQIEGARSAGQPPAAQAEAHCCARSAASHPELQCWCAAPTTPAETPRPQRAVRQLMTASRPFPIGRCLGVPRAATGSPEARAEGARRQWAHQDCSRQSARQTPAKLGAGECA